MVRIGKNKIWTKASAAELEMSQQKMSIAIDVEECGGWQVKNLKGRFHISMGTVCHSHLLPESFPFKVRPLIQQERWCSTLYSPWLLRAPCASCIPVAVDQMLWHSQSKDSRNWNRCLQRRQNLQADPVWDHKFLPLHLIIECNSYPICTYHHISIEP